MTDVLKRKVEVGDLIVSHGASSYMGMYFVICIAEGRFWTGSGFQTKFSRGMLILDPNSKELFDKKKELEDSYKKKLAEPPKKKIPLKSLVIGNVYANTNCYFVYLGKGITADKNGYKTHGHVFAYYYNYGSPSVSTTIDKAVNSKTIYKDHGKCPSTVDLDKYISKYKSATARWNSHQLISLDHENE